MFIRTASVAFVGLFVLGLSSAHAQSTPAASAVKLPDSLVFSGIDPIVFPSLVYHPVNQRYYSVRMGNMDFPIHTWLPEGGESIFSTVAGIDSRGMWYNPNTAQVERNCYSSYGWATVELDDSEHAVSEYISLFAGQLQPTEQSVGAFDPSTNKVLYYNAGQLHIWDRSTGTPDQSIPLTGTSLLNANTESVIYTGQLGYEIGVLDWVAKRVLLFNRFTGAFAGMSQLPANAPTNNRFRFAYANDRVWLFNATAKSWESFCIWSQSCIFLPVELINFQAACDANLPRLSWSTGSEQASAAFVVERSPDGSLWEQVGGLPAAGNSQQLIEYAWIDRSPLAADIAYYRLRQKDHDGSEQLSTTISLAHCGKTTSFIAVYPNPTKDILHVIAEVPDAGTAGWSLKLMDARGRWILQQRLGAADGLSPTDMDLDGLESGTYGLHLCDAGGSTVKHTVVVKH